MKSEGLEIVQASNVKQTITCILSLITITAATAATAARFDRNHALISLFHSERVMTFRTNYFFLSRNYCYVDNEWDKSECTNEDEQKNH